MAYPYCEGPYKAGAGWSSIRSPIIIDLTRFGFEDKIGCSSHTTGQISITVTFDFSEDLSLFATKPGPSALAAVPANSNVYAFLTVSSKMVLKDGVYSEAT